MSKNIKLFIGTVVALILFVATAARTFNWNQMDPLPAGHIPWRVSGATSTDELTADKVEYDPIPGIIATDGQGIAEELASSGGGDDLGDHTQTEDIITGNFASRFSTASDLRSLYTNDEFRLITGGFTGGNDWFFSGERVVMPTAPGVQNTVNAFYIRNLNEDGDTKLRPLMRLNDDYPIGNPGALPNSEIRVITELDSPVRQGGHLETDLQNATTNFQVIESADLDPGIYRVIIRARFSADPLDDVKWRLSNIGGSLTGDIAVGHGGLGVVWNTQFTEQTNGGGSNNYAFREGILDVTSSTTIQFSFAKSSNQTGTNARAKEGTLIIFEELH